MRLTKTASFVVLLLAAGISLGGARAQEELVRDHPGSWQSLPPVKPKISENVPVADRAAATTWENQLIEMLHRMPSLSQPRGYDVIPYSQMDFVDLDGNMDGKRAKFVRGAVLVNLASYERTSRGAFANERDSAASISISVNDTLFLSGSEKGRDDEGMIIAAPPESSGERHGYPLFELNQNHWVVLLRNKVPFFAPVTRERYLKYRIAEAQDTLDKSQKNIAKNGQNAYVTPEIRKTMNEGVEHLQQFIAASNKELSSMSPAQRRAAAWVADSEETEAPKFVEAGDTEGQETIYINPALMDAALPQSAPQIITVNIQTDEDKWPGLAGKLDKEIDWAFLQKMLH